MAKKSRIRPIAICLFRRGEEPKPDPKGDRILVHEGEDTVAGFRFGRPLGGGIEFGETSEAAVVREIREELGAEITAVRLLGMVESIYVYEGEPGHELVFVYDAQFVDETLYAQETLRVTEGKRVFTARWRSLDQLQGDPLGLVPQALWQYLQGPDS